MQQRAVQITGTTPSDAPRDAGVEHFNRIEIDAAPPPGHTESMNPAERPLAHARRQPRHRVRHNRDAARLMDRREGGVNRLQHRERPVNKECEQVPVPGRHFRAGDDADAAGAAFGKVARRERAPDFIVIGDGDEVEVGLLRSVVEQLRDTLQAVNNIRMQVNIRPPGMRQWRAICSGLPVVHSRCHRSPHRVLRTVRAV